MQDQAVTDALLGNQQYGFDRVCLQLLPQICHVDAQGSDLVSLGRTPDFPNDLLVRQHLARVLHEQPEQRICHLNCVLADLAVLPARPRGCTKMGDLMHDLGIDEAADARLQEAQAGMPAIYPSLCRIQLVFSFKD